MKGYKRKMGLITNCEEILNRDDFTFEELEVPEWGGTIRIRSLSGNERTKITNMVQKRKDGDGMFEQVVIFAAVDENGKRIFRDDHLAALKEKSASVTQRIGSKILELSGFNNPADSVPDVESAEKN